MYIRKTTSTVRGKTYTNHLLVQSVNTPNGPRQKTICSLGSLEPRPAQQWLALAHKLENALLGQPALFDGEDTDAQLVHSIAEKVRTRGSELPSTQSRGADGDDNCMVCVHADKIEIEQAREAGTVYVANAMYDRVGMEDILRHCGIAARTRLLTRIMVVNRLVCPLSEHAMPDWFCRTAVSDILGTEVEGLCDDALYRTMGKLHHHRAEIEKLLRHNERSLFELEDTIVLYDLTSHYFEGDCPLNPQAKRGYSRDSRPDCKQVVVGVVFDGDGFPYCHRVFDGNTLDAKTLAEILETLKKDVGMPASQTATVIVDRGMAYDENIRQIKDAGFHYIVAARQHERSEWLEQFEMNEGYHDIIRTPSPRNPFQKKSRVEIKKITTDDELIVLCIGEGRKEKDKAIRMRFEKRLLGDVEKMATQIRNGRLTDESMIHERIGRIKERYPRVARYYRLQYDKDSSTLICERLEDKCAVAEKLDGGYILKTDRQDMSDEQIWRTYMLLTRAENAFRNMKSPLAERPIFHHFEERVQVHIFLCIIAYHLLVAIEKLFLDKGYHTSWDTIRRILATHQIVTIALPTNTGKILRIRKATKPEPQHEEIYKILGMPLQIAKPRRIGWISNKK